jgi:hypothetical protein
MTDAADPVSWFLIEPGWQVVDAAGDAVGMVAEVTGDSTHDIFDGLAVDVGIGKKPRYVPSELVGEIVQGRVHLTIGKDELGREAAYEEPPESATVSSEGAGLGTRVGSGLTAPERKTPEPIPFTRRLWLRVKRLF